MKIALAFREAHEAETELAGALLRTGGRHESDHDVFQFTRTLSGPWPTPPPIPRPSAVGLASRSTTP